MALPGGNGVMSLIGCRVGHACPWAPPVDISPDRTSARKELRRITFYSGRRATFRLVRADYVAEEDATQIGATCRHSGAPAQQASTESVAASGGRKHQGYGFRKPTYVGFRNDDVGWSWL